ncbi:hypothetical protein GCM10027066_08570 [Dyella jejuensis]
MSVDDEGNAIGNCATGPNGGAPVAWFSATGSGAQTPMAPLVAGEPCSVVGATYLTDLQVTQNMTKAVGNCSDANGVSNAVYWNISSGVPGGPTVLKPRQGILGILLEDVASKAMYTNGTFAAGESISATGDITPVAWKPEGHADLPYTMTYDSTNCVPAGITPVVYEGDGSSFDPDLGYVPTMVLNCPRVNGTNGAELVFLNPGSGLLSGIEYSEYDVALNPPVSGGACVVNAIGYSRTEEVALSVPNFTGVGAAGSCTAPGGLPVAVTWPQGNDPDIGLAGYSFTATPVTRDASIGQVASNAVAISPDGGEALITYTTAGLPSAAAWTPNLDTFQAIAPPSGSLGAVPVGLSNNGTVALNIQTATQNTEAALWTPAGGVVPLGFLGGGSNSLLTTIAPNDSDIPGTTYSGGSAENSSGQSIATIVIGP